MWMKSRFAQWEVEGAVRERVRDALHEAEQHRLAQAAQSAERRLTSIRPSGSINAGLGLGRVHSDLLDNLRSRWSATIARVW